ncbi:MAG: MFS transporter [Saccharospirillum sp.]|nr:MFS transporter [Saccharospirillum sp.]
MLLFGLVTVFFGNFGQSFFISWYGASLQAELGLSASAYGTAYSAATLVSGLIIMAIGGLIDRVSVRLFATVVACGLILAALLMWQVNSLFSLVIALFLLRFCGQGLLPHTAITTMGRYFSLNRGKAISLAVNGVPLGEMILPSLKC